MSAFPNSPQFSAEQSANPMPVVEPASSNALQDKDPELLKEFEDLKRQVNALNKVWKNESNETVIRRNLRLIKVDVERERTTGELKPDEIYIPVRIIADNISKEAPQYISYLVTSPNVAIFKPKNVFTLTSSPLEKFFTDTFRFPGWEIPFFTVIDGAQLHGWDSVEILFDETKDGLFAVDQIGHDNLWFHEDCENLQKAPILIRQKKVTREDIRAFEDADEYQAELLFGDKDSNLNTDTKSVADIQKVFYRRSDGIVYVCWMNHEKNSYFVREPKPLSLNRKKIIYDELSGTIFKTYEIYETQYPIELLPYVITEDKKLMSVKGRAFLDEYIQEACSSLASSMVNSWHRASRVFGAPKQNDQDSGEIKITNTPITGGNWVNKPVDFFHMPYPDESGLTLIQGLITQNKAETSQINFAVNNRKDSRKTATEVQTASNQAVLLSGVQVTIVSMFLRNVYTRCWSITQSGVEQGIVPTAGLNPEYFKQEYKIYSAGDTEVIKRQEMLNSLKESYPVFAQTGAGEPMLEDYIKLAFTDRAPDYIRALRAGDIKNNLLIQLKNIIVEITKEHPEAIPDESIPQLGMLLQGVDQITQPQGEQQQPAQQPA